MRWPADVDGRRITVSGVAVMRHDLAVFVSKPGEPEVQGIPVQPGTNVYEARKRVVIEDAKWSVEADGTQPTEPTRRAD